MDEFIATVLLNSENKPTELLTFANSIEETRGLLKLELRSIGSMIVLYISPPKKIK